MNYLKNISKALAFLTLLFSLSFVSVCRGNVSGMMKNSDKTEKNGKAKEKTVTVQSLNFEAVVPFLHVDLQQDLYLNLSIPHQEPEIETAESPETFYLTDYLKILFSDIMSPK